MSSSDSGMYKVMALVLGAVVLFTLLCMTVAQMLSAGGGDVNDSMMRNALIQRIEPVGKVRTSADDLPGLQVADAGAAGGAMKSGEELVQGVCASCHAAGVAEAPLLDDEAAWGARRELGLEALVASVINGKGSMPPRGGSAYSDEEIEAAVKHIALFPEEEGAGEDSAAAEAPAEETVAVAETPAEGDAAAENEVAEAEMPADSTEGAADAGGMDLMALIASGTEPDGLTDNIKNNVNSVCSGCHVAGVANAPRTGDKEAWGARAELGLDALSQTVISGKGAMPPMGGSGLTAEEMPVAVQYLMSKQ